MVGCKARDAQQRGHATRLSIPRLEDRHVRIFIFSGLGGRADRDNLVPTNLLRQFLYQPRQLTHMNKQRIALPKPPLTHGDRKQLAATYHRISRQINRRHRGSIAAGIKAQHNRLCVHSAASLSRRIVPSTPLIKRPLLGSE